MMTLSPLPLLLGSLKSVRSSICRTFASTSASRTHARSVVSTLTLSSVPPLTETATDYDNGKLHIDIWTGSTKSSGGDTQIDCEDSLTPDDSQTVIISPGTSYTVNCMLKTPGSTYQI